MALSDRLEKIETQKARASGIKPSLATEKSRKGSPSGGASWGQMKRRVRDALMEELGTKLYAKSKADELKLVVSENLEGALKKAGISLPASQRPKFVAELTADLLGYGPLEELLSQPSITEIMCNGYNDIYVEKAGK
ncbi:MAG TPA: hypothetical protein VEU28_04845, partial [Actinomycetota bacterium]|nr:hypothetical protein [Actinomycetota bacterium]